MKNILNSIRKVLNPTKEEMIQELKEMDYDLYLKMERKLKYFSKEQVEGLFMMFF